MASRMNYGKRGMNGGSVMGVSFRIMGVPRKDGPSYLFLRYMQYLNGLKRNGKPLITFKQFKYEKRFTGEIPERSPEQKKMGRIKALVRSANTCRARKMKITLATLPGDKK